MGTNAITAPRPRWKTCRQWACRMAAVWVAVCAIDTLFPVAKLVWDYYDVSARVAHWVEHHAIASLFSWAVVRAFMLRAWLALECCFYLYYLIDHARLQKVKKPARAMSKDERKTLYWQCVSTVDDVRAWATGWFYYSHDLSRPTFDQIHRDTLCKWAAWAFWQEDVAFVRSNDAWAQELDWMIDTLERHYDVSFPPGDNKALHCIRLNLDPVLSVHRPLAVYVSIYVATTLFNTVFMKWIWQFKPYGAPSLLWGGPVLQLHRFLQFGRGEQQDEGDKDEQNEQKEQNEGEWPISAFSPRRSKATRELYYWYRAPSPGSNSKTPIVFIHGIGAGLMCYLELIWHMTRMDRPFFCIELPFVSMHMVDDVPDADTMVDAIHDMLHHHGFHQAVFVGHSLGTAVASWIMSRKPDIIAGTVLIDPICFLLHYPHVAFNFIYRAPKQWMDYIMLYVASRELYISHYISRHFQWFQCIFFADRLNKDMTLNHQSPLKRATVYISMKDSLVPSALVAKYLNRERVDCRTMPDLPHAGFLVNWTWRKRILEQIDRIASDVDDEAIDLSLDL